MLEQTVADMNIDVAIVSEPYKNLNRPSWFADRTERAAIWICGDISLTGRANTSSEGFTCANINNIYVYSCYISPNVSIENFQNFLDRLVRDAQGRKPLIIAGDFNAWAVE